MAWLFGNKKKNDDDNNAQNDSKSQSTPKASKSRNRNDTLLSVLPLTVDEKVLDELRQNKDFIVSKDGEVRYIAFLFDVTLIGGLSKKAAANSEDKGSLIETMEAGHISFMLTEELVEKDALIIIPTGMSLEMIEGFSIVSDKVHKIVLIDDDNNVEYTDHDVTVADLLSVAKHMITIHELMVQCGVTEVDGVDPDQQQSNAQSQPEQQQLPQSQATQALPAQPADPVPVQPAALPNSGGSDWDPDGDPDEGYEPGDSYNPDDDYDLDEPIEDPDAYRSPVMGDGDDGGDEEGDGEGDYDPSADYNSMYGESSPEVSVPDDFVSATIIRRFYSDDLGLEITTEPFEQRFVRNNDLILFEENRGEGWLNYYLSQMSKEANISLREQRAVHIKKLREMYLRLMEVHCDETRNKYDENAPGTASYEAKQILDRERRAKTEESNRTIAQKEAEIEESWRKAVEDWGNAAAKAARADYEERHRAEYEERKAKARREVRDKIEHDYQDSLRELREKWSQAAKAEYQRGEAETLKIIQSEYDAYQADETDRYNDWQRKISNFVDTNRKEDIARTKTLAEEQRQTDKADNVRKELTAQLDSVTSDLNSTRTRLNAELEETRRRDEQTIKHNQEVHAQEIERMQTRIDGLLNQYQTLEQNTKDEYENRLKNLERDKDELQRNAEHMIAVHKRSNIVMIALTVIAVITAAAIGIIIGMKSNQDYIVDATKDAVTSNMETYFNKKDSDIVSSDIAASSSDEEVSGYFNTDSDDEDDDSYYGGRLSSDDDEEDDYYSRSMASDSDDEDEESSRYHSNRSTSSFDDEDEDDVSSMVSPFSSRYIDDEEDDDVSSSLIRPNTSSVTSSKVTSSRSTSSAVIPNGRINSSSVSNTSSTGARG